MFFFLGLFVLLDRFLNGAWCFGNHGFNGHFLGDRGRSRLDHFGSWSSSGGSGSQLGFLLQTLFFTLATTHFTRVVRRAAAWGQGADRSCFNHWRWCFGYNWRFNHRGFNDRCRFSNNYWLGSLGFFNNRRFNHWRWCFSGSRLGDPVERGLFFANFTHGFGHGFSDGFDNRLFSDGWRFKGHSWFGSDFNLRLSFASRSYFDFRSSRRYDRSGGFNNRRFYWSSFQCCSGSAFSLLVGLSFSRSADHGAGNSSGNSQTSSQIGSAWCLGVSPDSDSSEPSITLPLASR